MYQGYVRGITKEEEIELTNNYKDLLVLSDGMGYRLTTPIASKKPMDFMEVLYDINLNTYGIRGDKCIPIKFFI